MTPAADLVRGWLEHSPYAAHLGIELVSLGEGEAELRLPFRDELATMGDVVHGGAISSLVDTAAAAAAVSAADGDELGGGTTVDLSVSLVGAARGVDTTARHGDPQRPRDQLHRGGRDRRRRQARREGARTYRTFTRDG